MKYGQKVKFKKSFVVGWWNDKRFGTVPKGATGIVMDIPGGVLWIKLDKAWPGYDAETWMNEEWDEFSVEIADELTPEDADEFLEAV